MSVATKLKGLACLLLTVGILAGLASGAGAQELRFGIMFGDEPTDFRRDRQPGQFYYCKTARQIRQAIESRGYADISLNVMNEPKVQVRATQGGTVYLIDYNYCEDEVIGRQALR